jgi:hypothetical protein
MSLVIASRAFAAVAVWCLKMRKRSGFERNRPGNLLARVPGRKDTSLLML